MKRFQVWGIAYREGLAYGATHWYVSVENSKFGFTHTIDEKHAIALIHRLIGISYDMWENRMTENRTMVWQVLKVIK